MRSMPALARTRRLSRPMAPASAPRLLWASPGPPPQAAAVQGLRVGCGRARAPGLRVGSKLPRGASLTGCRAGMARRPARVSLTCQSCRCRRVRACRQLAKRGFRRTNWCSSSLPARRRSQIGSIVQRFGLTIVAQETIGMLGRTVYTLRIANGQSVRGVIRRVEAAGLPIAVQPKYAYRLTQDHNNPNADLGDPAQYIVNKFNFAEVHRITKGDKAIVAVIDSEIDSNQPNLVGTVSDRYDAGCDASSPHPHGTGMAGAIA